MILKATAGVLPRRTGSLLALWVPYTATLAFILLSASRSVALVKNYGAPMRIYGHLPEVGRAPLSPASGVCVAGKESRLVSGTLIQGFCEALRCGTGGKLSTRCLAHFLSPSLM